MNKEELQNYKSEIEKFADYFVNEDGDVYLPAEETARFKQNVLEVIDLLNDILGGNNHYTQEINRTIAALSIPCDGSPTIECAKQVAAIIGAAHKRCNRKNATDQNQKSTPHSISFIDVSRLEELKLIGKEKYDLLKLIRLCEEINIAHQNSCYMTMAMLMRAIIDHVPPIFGVNQFSEVANNYKGAKSFKDSMTHLEGSLRKIADSHLHVQIRKKETLPTYSQVNFSAELDVLLAEIIRVLE